jgi:hypothetical protein
MCQKRRYAAPRLQPGRRTRLSLVRMSFMSVEWTQKWSRHRIWQVGRHSSHWTNRCRKVWGPFAKFVDSPYYSESELCGGAVTVSFSKYLPWQAMHFLQLTTHLSKMCCRPLITSKFASELHFHYWKSPEIAWSEIWIEFCVRLGKSGSVEPH